jgi:phosphate/phosphite/phosphonate ABC transporter binding protein
MKKQTHHISLILAVAALFLAATAGREALAQAAQNPKGKRLSLGIVFKGPREPLEAHFQDFVDYVTRKLYSMPDLKGRVVVAPTALQLVKPILEKEVDFYFESPYPTYLINTQGVATLLVRRWKGGMADYRSLLFTGKVNGATRVEDLRGKIIAFEDPGSTSGYFLPKLLLLKKGLTVTEKPGLEVKVSPNEIGYIFTYSDSKIVELVLAKKVAAGAFSDDDYSTLDENRRTAIVILTQSEPIPRHLVSVRKDLPPETTKRLKEILLAMHLDEEGQKILRQTDNTAKFDLLPGGEEMFRQNLVELFRGREKK